MPRTPPPPPSTRFQFGFLCIVSRSVAATDRRRTGLSLRILRWPSPSSKLTVALPVSGPLVRDEGGETWWTPLDAWRLDVGTWGAAHTHGTTRHAPNSQPVLLFSTLRALVTVGPVCSVIHSASAGILEGERTKALVRPICSRTHSLEASNYGVSQYVLNVSLISPSLSISGSSDPSASKSSLSIGTSALKVFLFSRFQCACRHCSSLPFRVRLTRFAVLDRVTNSISLREEALMNGCDLNFKNCAAPE